jgi:pimeloyl-ACP methyl ester carboxylesterase
VRLVLGVALAVTLGLSAACALGLLALTRGAWNPSGEDLRARYATPASKFIDLDGVRIHYVDEGRGPVLFLVHGAAESLRTWDGVAERLVSHYRVVRLDIPDHGLSGPDPAGRYGIADDLHRIEGLSARLGIDRLAIGGSSWGGTIAYSFAAAHPERVSALVLVSAPGMRSTRPGFHPPLPAGAFARWRARYYQTRDEVAATMRSVSVATGYLSPALVAQYTDFLNRRGRARERALKLEQILPDEATARATAVVAQVVAPTLVVWGRDNPAFGPENATDFAAALTHSRQVVTRIYPGVGHKVEREAPAALAADIDAFLAAHP